VKGDDECLWYRKRERGDWGDWQQLAPKFRRDPAAVAWSDGTVHVFAQGTDDRLAHFKWRTQDLPAAKPTVLRASSIAAQRAMA
jgi:hypothetical protein